MLVSVSVSVSDTASVPIKASTPYFAHLESIVINLDYVPYLHLQTEGAAHLQLISKVGLKYVVSAPHMKSNRMRLENDPVPASLSSPGPNPCQSPSTLGLIGPSERARIDLANRAFRRYSELQYSLSHTRCCKLKLSYRGK